MSATYYAPSVSGTVTTSWIPLTTTYSAGFGNQAATNYFWDGTYFSAWLWDRYLPGQAPWTHQANLPPEVTAAFMSTAWVYQVSATKVFLGPFAACPGAFYSASGSGSATTCCPISYSLYLGGDGGSTSATCTSTYSADQYMTFIISGVANGEGYYTVTLPGGSVTTSSANQTLIGYTAAWPTSGYLEQDVIITAPGIVGWNFDQQTGSSNSSSSTATITITASPSAIPTGAVAGLAVTSVLAGIGIITAIVFGWMLLGYGRRSRNLDNAETPAIAMAGVSTPYAPTAPAYKPAEQQNYYQPPTHDMQNIQQRHELGGNDTGAEMQ